MSDKKKHILVIDDEPDILNLVEMMFKNESDVELTCLNESKDALPLLGKKPYNLIVTDMKMPEVDGLRIVQEIRGVIGPNQTIPIIIFTAFKKDFDEMLSLKGQNVFFFEKILGLDKLKPMVIEKLNSTAQP